MTIARADYDFEKKLEIYRDGWKAIEAARAMPDEVFPEKTNIHFYWRVGNEFGRKQVLPLKAAIVSQNLENVNIHLWSNVDLTRNEWYKPISRHINFHIYDPIKEAAGTPLEGYNKILTQSDHLSWLDGDLFRLLILYKYGGVYVDMDMVLLRDLAPLLSVEFMYQWGTELDKINGAIMRIRKGSLLGRILLGFLPHVPFSPASTDWGSTLYGAVRQVYKDWIIFPCAFFNTEWQLFWNMSESAHPFKCNNPEQSSELFDGVFAWHWHNKWDAPIEPGCKYEILETKIRDQYAKGFDYMVSKEKRHLGGNRGGGDPGTFSPKLWRHLINTYSIKSVLDIGCGQGYAVNWFQNAGVIAIGIDGLPENLKNSPPNCFEHDLTEYAISDTPVDLVWCCEVVEHIEENYLINILQSFTNGQYVAMTYGTPGQSGYHHVNCKEKEYWIRALESIGYVYLRRETDMAREMAENGWFKKNGLLFVKGVKA